MNKITKRILSLIVVAVVMITSLPFSVMAETAANTDGKGMTIDLSKTDESIDEVLNNIQGLNALANGEKENAHQHDSSEKHTHTVDAQEVITDSESNSFEDGIFDIVVEETVEQEVDVKLESTTTTESPATDFEYSIENGEVTINDYIGSATEVVIPEKIEGYPVTSIGYYAFYYCSSLTSIAIPNGVTSIEYGAFYGCSSLTSIAIPDSVTSIGYYAFYYCSSLTSITIPDSVTSIGDDAFSDCSSLTSITIPDSVTSIGDWAFSDCSSLTSITIPDSVTSIGDGAFLYCYNLNHVYCTGNEAEWNNITIDSYNESITNAVIHFNVVPGSETSTKIQEATCTINRFEGIKCNYCDCFLETVEEKDTAIGHNYVEGICENCGLSEIFPLSYRFDKGEIIITDCDYKATTVEIPEKIEGYPVTRIGDEAFGNCSLLTSITIPDSVTSIGYRAFYYCSSLASITIPDSVTSIGDDAFSYCSALTSITIPDSVTSIGDYAFYKCSSLTSITVSADNHTYSSDDGVLLNKEKTILICCPGGKVGEYTIPDSVTRIGDRAFYYCSLLTSITIPDSVTRIGNRAFYYCSSLESITIPDSVTSIGDEAFDDCSSLTSITISDSVTSIGDHAFSYCSSLTSIIIPDSVTSIGKWAFYHCSSLTSITVSADNHTYSSDDGVLLNKEKTILICCPSGKVGEYTIPDRVTSIGDSAFSCCYSLTSITIPDSVTSIGDDAFFYCSSLTSITIPDSVTSIGYDAFGVCSSLASITIPDSVISIENYAFSGCSSLTSITIPDSVTSIGYDAFYGCGSLKTVNYTGSEELWNKISVYAGNDDLINADIHFNYIPGTLPEEITPSTDSNLVVDSEKSLVTGLTPEMSPVDVAAKFEGAENIQIVDKDGNVLEADALVGTGSKIQLVENGEVVDEVTVVIQGEIDGNGIIDSDDAIYMLRNTLFPDMFPVVVDDDIDGNGVYDSDDAIYLLRYTLFPDMFPLK